MRCTVGVIAAVLAMCSGTAAVETVDERRLTSATNVRLREAPTPTAPVVADLTFGTSLVSQSCGATAAEWCQVVTDDGRHGWVAARLTVLVEPGRELQASERIVAAKLDQPWPIHEDVAAARQVLDFVERVPVPPSDREGQARFALYRLKAIGVVAGGIPWGPASLERFRPWLESLQREVGYDEPGGSWMVNVGAIDALHERFHDTIAADDIAWFLVENGVGGECEGDVPCYLERIDSLSGRYLRWHPRGMHAQTVVRDVASALNGILDNLEKHPGVLQEFDPSTRCQELSATVGSLRAALNASGATAKPTALSALDRYAALCQ